MCRYCFLKKNIFFDAGNPPINLLAPQGNSTNQHRLSVAQPDVPSLIHIDRPLRFRFNRSMNPQNTSTGGDEPT
jgi:hypothetical protein